MPSAGTRPRRKVCLCRRRNVKPTLARSFRRALDPPSLTHTLPTAAVVFLIALIALGLQTLLLRPFRVLLLNIVWFVALLCLMGLSLLLVLKRTSTQQALLESPYINNEAWFCVALGLGLIVLGALWHAYRRQRGHTVWPVATVSRKRSRHQRVQQILKQGHGVLERCWHGSRFLVGLGPRRSPSSLSLPRVSSADPPPASPGAGP